MPKGKSDQHTSILEYALRHLEQERDEIQAKIDHVQGQLGQRGNSAPAAAAPAVASEAGDEATGGPRKKRTLSASARKRIALAQKKRWAEHRKAQGKA